MPAILSWSILFTGSVFLLSCNSVQKLHHQDALRKIVFELGKEKLEQQLPEDADIWAGVKATKFLNGERLQRGEVEFSYEKRSSRAWQERRHIVKALVEMTHRRSRPTRRDVLEIDYIYREKGPWSEEVQLEFIEGFPGDDFLLRSDPFIELRRNQRWIKALQQRRVFVGMPEELIVLALGKPISVESSSSFLGVIKKLIYPRQIIHVRRGKVSKRVILTK